MAKKLSEKEQIKRLVSYAVERADPEKPSVDLAKHVYRRPGDVLRVVGDGAGSGLPEGTIVVIGQHGFPDADHEYYVYYMTGQESSLIDSAYVRCDNVEELNKARHSTAIQLFGPRGGRKLNLGKGKK